MYVMFFVLAARFSTARIGSDYMQAIFILLILRTNQLIMLSIIMCTVVMTVT